MQSAVGPRIEAPNRGPTYPGAVRLILNVLWLVLAGFWLALGYVVAGVVACVFIVTIPFGIAAFRIAAYALWPFGRTVVAKPSAGDRKSVV